MWIPRLSFPADLVEVVEDDDGRKRTLDLSMYSYKQLHALFQAEFKPPTSVVPVNNATRWHRESAIAATPLLKYDAGLPNPHAVEICNFCYESCSGWGWERRELERFRRSSSGDNGSSFGADLRRQVCRLGVKDVARRVGVENHTPVKASSLKELRERCRSLGVKHMGLSSRDVQQSAVNFLKEGGSRQLVEHSHDTSCSVAKRVLEDC